MKVNLNRRLIAPQVRTDRAGVSLAEVILALTITSAVAATTLVMYGKPANNSKRNACRANCELLNTKAFYFYQQTGEWPASDFHELDEVVLTCPLDGTDYRFDLHTHSVVGHQHE
jgi:hypothetical protein